ncbi:hypothetical protein OIU79_021039 [Salix purpurea]|uniref:Uncharacterized protein n=1 Tax=Salix purpurea TaxID=77065 RepID=A0A9Q1AGG1_SALPP|nr:hypothetical protein OIU79_021039 [Salix purpurea]
MSKRRWNILLAFIVITDVLVMFIMKIVPIKQQHGTCVIIRVIQINLQ